MTSATWYVRRLAAMSPTEMLVRARHETVKRSWRRAALEPGDTDHLPLPPEPRHVTALPSDALGATDPVALRALVERADEVVQGRYEALGVTYDLSDPDWFLDPLSGRRAPHDFCFSIPYRDVIRVGDIKHVWELSRHHHLTVLAASYAATGDETYARRIERDLRGWIAANPWLSGPHWTSGIELGIRLISWVWTRRLLSGWEGAPALFERNDDFVRQVARHQQWLRTLTSHGSSANNHVIAEAAGLVVSSCAFDWFGDAGRDDAIALLVRQLEEQTFPSGVGRELATEYQALITELAMVAIVELRAAGHPFPDALTERFGALVDAALVTLDGRGRPPRQGDGDDGQVLVLDGNTTDRWRSIATTARHLVGAADWWPPLSGQPDVRSSLLAAIVPDDSPPSARPNARPPDPTDAGVVILRAVDPTGGETWCRFDAGPHGFRSIAAHAHADALSVELRVDGVDVLADPGTFAYHGDPRWRSYTRSTIGHNTVEVDGVDQSTPGGPFLWTTAATATIEERRCAHDGSLRGVTASHDGYTRLRPRVVHRRAVDLSADDEIRIIDELPGLADRPIRMAYHLGPGIDVEIDESTAVLRWSNGSGDAHRREATIRLDRQLRWSTSRGDEETPLGWYSPAYGIRHPATTLVGEGRADHITTVVRIAPSRDTSDTRKEPT